MAKKGHIPWNKGLTKEIDERVAKQAKKMVGRKFTEGHCNNISLAKRGKIPPFLPWRDLSLKEQKNLKEKISESVKLAFNEGRLKKQFGKDNPSYQKEIKQKISKAFTDERRLQAALRCIERNSEGYRPSKFEKRIMELINQNTLPYKYVGDGREGSFFGKVPDFINVNGDKIFVEAYEDRYWHDKNYVRTRRAFFKKFGFETRFIHYDDSDEEIIKKLR